MTRYRGKNDKQEKSTTLDRITQVLASQRNEFINKKKKLIPKMSEL